MSFVMCSNAAFSAYVVGLDLTVIAFGSHDSPTVPTRWLDVAPQENPPKFEFQHFAPAGPGPSPFMHSYTKKLKKTTDQVTINGVLYGTLPPPPPPPPLDPIEG